jgi:hypothetical protein
MHHFHLVKVTFSTLHVSRHFLLCNFNTLLLLRLGFLREYPTEWKVTQSFLVGIFNFGFVKGYATFLA